MRKKKFKVRDDWIGSAWTADKTSFISDIVSVVPRRPVPATCQKRREKIYPTGRPKKKKNVIEDVVSLIERRDECGRRTLARTEGGGRKVVANSRERKNSEGSEERIFSSLL